MKKKNIVYCTLSFLIPMLMMVVTFALAKVYPFGNNTAVVGDMKNQYAAILTYGKENFFNIHRLLYSNSLALGGNFYAVLTYYLFSPINLIALFFSNKYIPLFYFINICLNAGCIGLTTYIFLLKSKFVNSYVDKTMGVKTLNVLRVIFSTIFTLSTFYVQYSHTIMWFDAIIFFPLVLLGYEQLIDSNKAILYCISLILLILSNYYIGVMVLVFLLVLTLFWIVLSLVYKKEYLLIMKKSIYLLLYTILPIGVGTIVLLPSFLGQQAVYQEKYRFSLDKIYPLRDSLGSLLNGNMNNADIPMLYTSIFTLIAVTVFFISDKIDLKIKVTSFVAIILLFISTWIKGLYMIWHAFSMPNGYSQREAYIILLVLITIGYIGSTYVSSGYISFIIAGIIWSLIGVFITYRWNFLSNQQLLVDILLIIIEILAIILMYKKSKKYIWLLLFIILGEIGFLYYPRENVIAQTSIPMDSYVKLTEANKNVLAKLNKNDHSFYRIGSTIQLNENDPLMYGYNGLSTYVSQQSKESTDYLSALGYYQKHSWIRWSSFNNGSTAAVNRMLGLKYVIAPKNKNLLDATISGKSMSTSDSATNFPEGIKENSSYFNIYKDKETLPIVFKTENTAKNVVINYNPVDDPFLKLNSLFLQGFGISNMYQEMKSDLIKQNEVSKEYAIDVVSDGNVYCYLPIDQNVVTESSIKVSVNGKHVTTMFGENVWGENGIVYLGSYKKGTKIHVNYESKDIQSINPVFAVEHGGNLLELNKFKKGITDIKVNGNLISFDKKTEDTNLAISVPYDSAWTAEINGKPVQTYKTLGGLLGIRVIEKGKVNLKYNVPGLRISIIISTVSVVVLCLCLVLRRNN